MKPKIVDIPIRKFMNEPRPIRVLPSVLALPANTDTGSALVPADPRGLAPYGTVTSIQPATPGAICTRRRANGALCGRPADGGRDECWLHAEWYSLLPAIYGMPYPEDAVAIHQILSRTMSMVIGGEISPQKGQAITKLCRELRRNLLWYQREMGMY